MAEELLASICSEGECEQVKKWCEENECTISAMFETRLEKADELREQGNQLLKDGDFEAAQLRYFAAIFQLDFSMAQYGPQAKPYEDKISTRKLKTLSNLCVARLKHQKYTETKAAAEVGLKVVATAQLDAEATTAHEAKFWYLTGQSNLERGFSENAVEELKKAQALAPGDRQVHQALSQALAAKRDDKVSAEGVWKKKLMTEDEILCQGQWWRPATLLARFRERRRLKDCCGRRREQEKPKAPEPPPPAAGYRTPVSSIPRRAPIRQRR